MNKNILFGRRLVIIDFTFKDKLEMENTQYINIQGWMVNELQLKDTELIIYAIVYGFSQDGESKFIGSLTYLEGCTNKSKSSIKRALSSLVDKSILIKHSETKNNITFNSYKHNKQKLKFDMNPRGQNEPASEVKMNPPTEVKMTPNNTNLDNKKDKTNIKEKVNSLKLVSEDVKELLMIWLEAQHPKAKTQQVQAHERILKDYPESTQKTAIDNAIAGGYKVLKPEYVKSTAKPNKATTNPSNIFGVL